MRGRIPLAACVLAVAYLVGARATSPVRVDITFGPSSDVSPSILSSALREAAEIWAKYGVSISESLAANRPADVSLSVFIDAQHEAGEGDACLGDIRFGADGLPDVSVTLYYRPLARFASDAAGEWPIKVQEQILSRVMGRALAHEIGHFMLRWPHHGARGLMRSRLRASALTDPSRSGFGLTPPERDRLQIVLSAHEDALAAAAPHRR